MVSSASVLYFSNEVTYSDNTTENVELVAYPCPVFAEGESLVMQRGAGMCVVRSSEEREKAAMTFLKWLTEPEVNTRLAVSSGYLPVTTEAIEEELPAAVEGLTEEKYIELYQALSETEKNYEFYVAPQSESYLQLEESFENEVRSVLRQGREDELLQSGGEEAIRKALEDFRNAIGK